MQRLPVEHTSSHFGVKQFEPPQLLSTSGVSGVSGMHAGRCTDEGYQGHQGPGSIFSWACGLLVLLAWQPKSGSGGAMVRTVLMYAAEAHAWQPRHLETLDNASNTTHCKIPSRTHARLSKEAWSTHSSVSLQVRRSLWAKKWLQEETYTSRG